jgi:hypothetical protein
MKRVKGFMESTPDYRAQGGKVALPSTLYRIMPS